MTRRTLATGVLFVSALVLPWWVTAAGIVIALVLFEYYYEAIFIGLVIDVVFGAPREVFFGFPFLFTAASSVALLIITLVRNRIRFDGIGSLP